jgi:hypothetical protein
VQEHPWILDFRQAKKYLKNGTPLKAPKFGGGSLFWVLEPGQCRTTNPEYFCGWYLHLLLFRFIPHFSSCNYFIDNSIFKGFIAVHKEVTFRIRLYLFNWLARMSGKDLVD